MAKYTDKPPRDGSNPRLASIEDIVDRVLSYPGFGIHDPLLRRALTRATVAEVEAQGLLDRHKREFVAIREACRKSLDHLRPEYPTQEPAQHIPTGVMVSLALTPAAMAAPTLEAATAHLKTCQTCQAHMDLIRNAATHVAGTLLAGAVEQEIGEPELGQAARLGPRKIPGASTSAPSSAPGRKPKLSTKPLHRSEATLRTRRGPGRFPSKSEPYPRARILVLTLLILVMAIGFFWLKHDSGKQDLVSHVADLARLELPPLPRIRDRPPQLEDAFLEMERGAWGNASRRFRIFRKRQPQQWIGWYYEGLCWLQVGKADSAREALEVAYQLADDHRVVTAWYLAQAALLQGDLDRALQMLSEVDGPTSPLKDQARDLEQELQSQRLK